MWARAVSHGWNEVGKHVTGDGEKGGALDRGWISSWRFSSCIHSFPPLDTTQPGSHTATACRGCNAWDPDWNSMPSWPIQECAGKTNECCYYRDNFINPLIPSVLLLAGMTTASPGWWRGRILGMQLREEHRFPYWSETGGEGEGTGRGKAEDDFWLFSWLEHLSAPTTIQEEACLVVGRWLLHSGNFLHTIWLDLSCNRYGISERPDFKIRSGGWQPTGGRGRHENKWQSPRVIVQLRTRQNQVVKADPDSILMPKAWLSAFSPCKNLTFLLLGGSMCYCGEAGVPMAWNPLARQLLIPFCCVMKALRRLMAQNVFPGSLHPALLRPGFCSVPSQGPNPPSLSHR